MALAPPPILPDIEEELKKYLLCPERLPIHKYERNQQFWPRDPNPKELFEFEGSPLSTTLKVQRDQDTGKIIGFREALLPEADANPMNSTSLNRAPAPPCEATRGNAMFIPFWPGSFPDPVTDLPDRTVLLKEELLTVPPGFTRGLNFDADGKTVLRDGMSKAANPNIKDDAFGVLKLIEKDFPGILERPLEKEECQTEKEEQVVRTETLPEEDGLIPNELPVLEISSVTNSDIKKGTEWAIHVDTTKPPKDFYERIPEMAHQYDFELDAFQKYAILNLEKHDHVFVAAHTSAGKTVVAEYAIALSQKHMTRTIYTSPIKALSNQKYRDFKRLFKDVGLITGDFQINPTASCLIMTTEILRSMLYCGSDIARDLEYVIFDEVHYINDRERGHVWEQVLIMLPAHVCVVLLSATVPNCVEFADWLGRTHQRKVYVISTYKRPVPLKHFLYTGHNGLTRHDRFLLLDVDTWRTEGYKQAVTSLQTKASKSRVPKNTRGHYHNHNKSRFNPKEETNRWSELVEHLKVNDLLPVVAFVFSRAKCDKNSENLKFLDLTTQKEKDNIRIFYEKCISSLKKPDRNIPQVILMRDILVRGIGVHHSGVLPIIKEIVEMLFQRGLIKLLFATETFAMGVNMPARTVVFDALNKHDGQENRFLKPAEYIQMAGRAGRRGLDKEGTVIILCKDGVPEEVELQKVMRGKPSQLESQFRLTYGMVLSLLRVESITVEGMMSRSFRESNHQKSLDGIKIELAKVNKELEELCTQELSSYLKPLADYFDSAKSFLKARNEILSKVYLSPKLLKVLIPGRILLITHKNHINKLALLLERDKNSTTFKVLVLTDNNEDVKENKDDMWYKMLSLAKDKVFCPSNAPGHQIISITCLDIMEISSKLIDKKIDLDLVMKDWQKRQIERFKSDPPASNCAQAIKELHKLTMLPSSDKNTIDKCEYLHFISDVKINEKELYDDLKYLYALKDRLSDHLPSTQIPNFEQQFSVVFSRKFLEEKKKDLEFELSSESMALYPDYEKRIELLRQLEYINSQNRVELKGRVACEMGMNELLITELVLKSVFKNLQPAEIAALLSALVFQVKARKQDSDDSTEELTENLKKGIYEITEVHRRIAHMEMRLGINTDEFQGDLNFGLVRVVYEWANQKPFAEIMSMTEIQEGIIVRCIQQLNETICDVRDAARIIGDPELRSKMEDASSAIKRDIVFAASLYTQGESFIL